jgi:hypothetical protein
MACSKPSQRSRSPDLSSLPNEASDFLTVEFKGRVVPDGNWSSRDGYAKEAHDSLHQHLRKGAILLRETALLGVNFILLIVDKLERAGWPCEAIGKLITMPENLAPQQILNTVSYLARENRIDRIVPTRRVR